MKRSVKRDSSIVKEYVQRISNEDLFFILEKLDQPICGDRAEICSVFEKDKDIDRWLLQSKGAEDWFDKVDSIQESAIMEISRRQVVKK